MCSNRWVGFPGLVAPIRLAWILHPTGRIRPSTDGTPANAKLMSGREAGRVLAAHLLSLVSVWRVLLAQGECWSEIETQA